jgi:hypothetical protein
VYLWGVWHPLQEIVQVHGPILHCHIWADPPVNSKSKKCRLTVFQDGTTYAGWIGCELWKCAIGLWTILIKIGAYDNLLLGATLFLPCERIWKSWAPPKCKMFMWLVAHKRCWTADCLAWRGLFHPEKCPFYDQEDETIDHLLVACVFTRQFWYLVLRQVGLHSFAISTWWSSFLWVVGKIAHDNSCSH